MKYLKPEHMVLLKQRCEEIDGMIALAARIQDNQKRLSIVGKLEASKAALQAEYSETEMPDGSVRIKHPSFAMIQLFEAEVNPPKRLFYSSAKSLSTIELRIHKVDAVVGADGNISCILGDELMKAELTQEAFANLLSHSSGQRFPITYRQVEGNQYEFPGDASQDRGRLLMEAASKVPGQFAQWGDEIMKCVERNIEKGGVMSQKSRQSINNSAEIVTTWMRSNPYHHAKELAKHATEVANTVKLEVQCATRLKETE